MSVMEPQSKPREKDEQRQNGHPDGMTRLAAEVKHHYTQPVPEAEPVQTQLFPAPLMRSLGWSALAGALIGLVMGVLLFESLLVVPGWEGLFSMGPFTFHVFWVLMGLAAGVLFGGVGSILAGRVPASSPAKREREEPPQGSPEPPPARERAVRGDGGSREGEPGPKGH